MDSISIYHPMDPKVFEEKMYEEWKKNVLTGNLKLCTSPYFDKVYDLRNELYELFHPLGISSCGIHAVAKVFSEIEYAMEDDGDLSIVVAYTDCSLEEKTWMNSILKTYTKKELKTPKPIFSDVFVMNGWEEDLKEHKEYVEPHALRHCPNRVFVKYSVRSFNYDVLDQLHALIPRFNKARELAHNDTTGDGESYFTYTKETDRLLIQIVEE